MLDFPTKFQFWKVKKFPAIFIKQKEMSSADPDSNQGPKDIIFSTFLLSTNWAIGGCLKVSRFDL